ncbi:MAG: saccharopine dehydrogenase C-terminal domain-containing protein, partial [Chitinophagaceae bacterium]
VDNDMKSMEKEIKERRLIFLCEMGLDPGIDHMSAMQLIHRIQASGGKITHFYSHCGGLIAPESDDNPWHYKISWNPRNIVTAGSSGAVFKENNRIIERTYPDLFNNAPTIQCKAVPPLEWYPNRDSLSYIPVYGLEDASTFIRTTLRFRHFCSGWHTLASLALTDTSDTALVKTCSTYHKWITKKIASADAGSKQLSEYLAKHVPENIREITTKQMEYLALDRNEALPNEMNCSADILQHILEGKLALGPEDKDMIVMIHEIHYKTHEGEDRDLKASLVVKGDDSMHTAMAKTVGLPLAIAADLILSGKIQTPGLQIPIAPEIYEPVLTALEAQGICFEEE